MIYISAILTWVFKRLQRHIVSSRTEVLCSHHDRANKIAHLAIKSNYVSHSWPDIPEFVVPTRIPL